MWWCMWLQRGKVGQTSWDCQEELFRQEVENADDLRLSYRLLRKCMGDKQKFCADIKPGGCPQATPLCCMHLLLSARQTSRKIAENCQACEISGNRPAAGSWQWRSMAGVCVSDQYPLQPACLARDRRARHAGGSRAKDCLEEHREDAGFSAECKEEFEGMMEARAADFRLDSGLSESCASDIEDICGYERVWPPPLPRLP